MKILKRLLCSFLFAAACFYGMNYLSAAPRSTSNLRAYEGNLDTLSDKENNLHQLIEETQRFRTLSSTCPAPGGKIILPGIATDDTIVSVVRHSSANITLASSTTVRGTQPDGTAGPTIAIESKIPGAMGNNITFSFVQIDSQTLSSQGTLTVNTTGYAFQVGLSTGVSAAYYSSATMVVNAINNDPSASALVRAYVVSFGSGTFIPITGPINLNSGSGSTYTPTAISPSFFTISSSQTVTVSTGAPVSSNDYLKFNLFDRPDGD